MLKLRGKWLRDTRRASVWRTLPVTRATTAASPARHTPRYTHTNSSLGRTNLPKSLRFLLLLRIYLFLNDDNNQTLKSYTGKNWQFLVLQRLHSKRFWYQRDIFVSGKIYCVYLYYIGCSHRVWVPVATTPTTLTSTVSGLTSLTFLQEDTSSRSGSYRECFFVCEWYSTKCTPTGAHIHT